MKFSDGTAFDAAAVCYNFDRWYNFTGALQSPDVSAYWQDTFGGFKRTRAPTCRRASKVLHRGTTPRPRSR